jgi:hypothetical protein
MATATPELNWLDILFSAPVEAPKPAAPKHEHEPRYYYRCSDCLAVAVTEARIPEVRPDNWSAPRPNAVCDACEGRIEYLGEAERHTLAHLDGWRPACDGKCVGARGPSCDCKCGGENHGTGLMVPVYTHSEIPRVGIPKEAAAKGSEYRALRERFRAAWDARYKSVTERKRYEYLGPELFRRFLDGQQLWKEYSAAKSLRTHTARNKKLARLIEQATSGVL